MVAAGDPDDAAAFLSTFDRTPDQSGSIILTTVTDIVGFFSFLGLATLFARLL